MADVTETLPAGRHIEGTFLDGVEPEDLVYFLVNVGDGDMQVLLLPEREDGARLAMVVDAARGHKLNEFIDHLIAAGLLTQPQGGQELFPLVCATHPHHDHIAGMGAFLNRWHDDIGEFWEPGYYHPSGSFHEMMRAVGRHEICHGQPTSGFTRYIGLVRITVLTPGIQLRNRFDTYGIDINNSSLSLKVDFPAVRVESKPGTRELHARRLRKLILGADSQMLSWAQAQIDFPDLSPSGSEVAKLLHKRQGASPLRADLLKVPHHGSKHGTSLELIEQIAPRIALLSCGPGGGRYNFPHLIALEALREARQPIAGGGTAKRRGDSALGIHITGAHDADDTPLGSIGVVIGPKERKWDIWRFGDRPDDALTFANARRFTPERVAAG